MTHLMPCLCAVSESCRKCDMQRIGVIAARGQTQRERQVGRPDVDGVQPRRGADGIEVGQALLRLDHGHDDDLVVGVGHVVGAAVVHGAHGPLERIPTGG